MSAKNRPWQAVQRAIEKPAIHRTIRTVVFAWSISIEQPHDNRLGAVLQRRIANLHFVNPLRHRIVIQLLDLILVHHRFDHQVRPVAVNFRRRKVDEPKLQTLLQTNDVLRADGIGAPEGLVKVFAVPTTEFSGAVIDVVEWTTAFEHTFDLPELAHVATRVKRYFDVGAQAETDLVGLMGQVAGHDVMTTPTQLGNQPGADRAQTAGDQNIRHESNESRFQRHRATRDEHSPSALASASGC